ncbi:beta-galactosidase/beta-glucuronidase [Paenibacillus castaneae]|uniref:glycoside hydrolase family 2 protein n=1 Tax=Paenibacillus castaneae TaxID=474957 RepID=UPI000C9CAFB0|nr:sugar-binding domain-containing protein [Paenibacillus castaneae]NIK79579.1 beta-galactosidase/beta-glucuronidase [Paenibacillus castaneae]
MIYPLRNEYPRPQFERSSWLNLNGEWEFTYDDSNVGSDNKWFEGKQFDRKIQVPFCYQSELSGINEKSFHDIVWYSKNIELPSEYAGKRILIHFGAVDYEAKVWVNGHLVASHEGGHTPFHADITAVLNASGANRIVVRAQDYSKDVTLPRGKQYWKENSEQVFYTRTTGIWQTVWIEAVNAAHVSSVRLTPDIDSNKIHIRSVIEGSELHAGLRLGIKISFEGELIAEDVIRVMAQEEEVSIKLHDFNDHGLGRWWSPEKPNLYDVEFTLLEGERELDRVKSYFGMRKISIEDGVICLNNRPYYMKLILDQGYFPGGVLTAPSDEMLRMDVELAKQMGFNGARKHQKVEDPRYLYWCDQLGLLVWGEMANAYQYSEQYVSRIMNEWQEAVHRDYNHPCIVVWVPLNESWGTPNILIDKKQQYHASTLYYLTKSLDETRPVISNDGWEHVKSDIYTIHDYESREEILALRYATPELSIKSDPQGRKIIVPGFSYNGEPVQLSEFGGISYIRDNAEGWGYSSAQNDQDFLNRLIAVMRPVIIAGGLQGYCYTQLTDVEQEKNGLLTFDREPKLPVEIYRKLNAGITPVLTK